MAGTPAADRRVAGKICGHHRLLARVAVIDEATERLGEIGAEKTATRFLYSAMNPIGEECFRACGFKISERLLNEVTAGSGALDRSLAG